MTIEQAIEQYENSERMNKELAETSVYPTAKAYYLENAEKCKQMIAWLRELQELRKAPEIVRCGECRHNGTRNCLLNLWATIFNSKPKDDFFCGMAERRTDG